ncbi:MAG: MBL fold metallo-hydrolase [Candidatus Cloacimonetes bacterium]|nr:MBL fold metallo-hydrolase [Candidatus Cloacimonadota bacterium]
MTRITILVEDSPVEGLRSEHGLSMLVEFEGGRILFDTGQSDAFIRNAATLGVSLDKLDAVIISHPHFDHADGLRHLRATTPLYVSEEFFVPRYRIGNEKNIGACCNEEQLREQGFKLHTVSETTALPGEAIIVTGFHNPHPLEREPSPFAFDPPGIQPDTFPGELMLAIPVVGGYAVLGGCCHAGVIGMLERCRRALDAPIRHFIGGMHLLHADEERVRTTGMAMGNQQLESLWIGHCTGKKAVATIEKMLNIPVHRLRSGLEILLT